LQPLGPLDLNTAYTFEVTPKVKDTRGGAFRPYSMSFTTVANVKYDTFPAAFEQLPQSTTDNGRFASMTIGPDHKLYAATFDSGIRRFAINAHGALGPEEIINTIADANQQSRLIVGLRFDPKSTADNLILWTTHSPAGFNSPSDWSGKISTLSGPNLQYYQDVVVGLPRAVKDHVSLRPDFGPDGALYFSQGSNTAMGAPDRKWGFRHERLLTAAILRLDPKLIHTLPLNVKTEDDGHYDPFAPNAPLTIYASGVRVSYEVLWHSNGRLYAGVNASAAHGNTPPTPEILEGFHRIDQDLRGAYKGPAVPAIWDVLQTQPDYITVIQKGGYYGHPNPMRGEFVQNGGNPTGGNDLMQCPQYPVGTMPDRNWRPPSYLCGKNISPNGIIEYHGSAFGSILDHKILITRYSGGKDIAILTLDGNGDIVECATDVDGMSRFADPLDIVEDTQTGLLYVDELGARRITLLRPLPGTISRHVLKQQVSPPSDESHFAGNN
jgi:glucose/arabinose dehydrogenase